MRYRLKNSIRNVIWPCTEQSLGHCITNERKGWDSQLGKHVDDQERKNFRTSIRQQLLRLIGVRHSEERVKVGAQEREEHLQL